MKRISLIVASVAISLLLVACGQQRDAEQLVEKFIEQYAVAPEEIKNVSFQRLDSTKLISDSLVIVMQQRSHELFKEGIDYPVKSEGGKLYFVSMNFTYKGDTLRKTFYMDESLEHIIAFK